MAEARHFCPDCGSIDLVITQKGLIVSSGSGSAAESTARCPNCSWSGKLSDTIGAVTSEQFWDAERVGDVMLRVLATNAAGPLVQVLEFIGLLPRKRFEPEDKLTGHTRPEEQEKYEKALALFNDPSTPLWNDEAQKARDAVMQKLMEAALVAAFTEAEKQNRLFAIATDTDIHPMLKEESADKVFGGDQPKGKKKRMRKR